MYSEQCTVCDAYYTIYTVQFIQCTVYGVYNVHLHCIMYNLCNVHCTSYSIYSVQGTLYNVQCTLYSIYIYPAYSVYNENL